MVTVEQAQNYIDNKPGVTSVAALLATALELINDYVGTAIVPEHVLDNATLTLVQELALRERSPGGVNSFAGGEVIQRVSRDPMASIYPMLRPWAGGFA